MESVPKGYPVNSANTVQNDAYTLFNLRLGYDYKPWNFRCVLRGPQSDGYALRRRRDRR